MSSQFLEIVQLKNGDIVLKRSDDEGEPLISICFSDESKSYIGESRIEIAKVMIQAGIQAAAQALDSEFDDYETDDEDGTSETKHLLH